MAIKNLSQENFHKICVVGGGITGAIMVLLLKKSNLFKLSDIGWIKPKRNSIDDLRTTFFNKTSLQLLNQLNILKTLNKNDFTPVKKIKVFGANHESPLEWDYLDAETKLGAVIKNNVILNIIEEKVKDINNMIVSLIILNAINLKELYI